MAPRYSPFWDLRKKGPRFKPSGVQGEIPSGSFPNELDLGVLPMALSGLVCFCCCCTSGKYIGNKQLSKFILDVYPLKTTLIYENFNQLYKLVGT
jgi:hypothetical protein